jgi:hypothetical protein
LIDVAPELVSELQRLLAEEGESELASQAAQLCIVERCRCGDFFCSTFYTAPRLARCFGSGHRTIALEPDAGYLNVDVVGANIVQIEILYRADLRAKIHAALP